MQRIYECCVILRSSLVDQEIKEMEKSFAMILCEEGSIVKKEDWGIRSLAYSIRRKRKGRYMLFYFSAEKDAMARLEKKMDLSDNVLRYLSCRVKKVPDTDSAMVSEENE